MHSTLTALREAKNLLPNLTDGDVAAALAVCVELAATLEARHNADVLADRKRESPEPKDEDDASPLHKKAKKDEFESGDSREMTLSFSFPSEGEKEVKDETKD